MDTMQLLILAGGVFTTLLILVFAFSGPSVGKAQSRRIDAMRERHGNANIIETQMRRIAASRSSTRTEGVFDKIIPKPELLKKRIAMTGKTWSLPQYFGAGGIIAVCVTGLAILQGLPVLLGLLLGAALGLGLPHMVVGFLIKRRIGQFNTRFPDAIELMVRGLRSGLPITETLGIVGTEVPDPVGIEFRNVGDRIRIGRTMEMSLQETADRLGTPEFQFFCITLAIQRETGGNLAETLSNLAEVLRKRAQMKLKIKAMSSESKASAYIIGALPFIVFGLIYSISPKYMDGFFVDERLMIAGMGGAVWMSIGAFIMSRMISFEI
jgi:tight adherence protein B